MIGYIYKITSPTGKIYIGQTRDIRKRFSQYFNLHCEDQVAIYNSLKKHGPGRHTFEVVYECPVELLNFVEEVFIRVYDSMENGLNCRSGGGAKVIVSEETKKRMSIAQRALNKVCTEEHKEYLRQKFTGRPSYAKSWSEESKKRQSERFIGRPSGRRKKVIAYNENEEVEFDSLAQAAERFLGEPSSTAISKLIRNDRQRFGYHWKYKTYESQDKKFA